MTRKMRLEIGLLKAGEIAKEAGILKSTVRYYTDKGILKVKELTESGYRLYDRRDSLKRIDMVRKVNEGYATLSEIKMQMAS